MNKINFFIILFCFYNLLICAEVEPSFFSNLLGNVRKEVINNALVNIPNKQNMNILQMCNTLAKTKEKYSLNDAESAFFAYKWITENIDFDWNQKNRNTAVIYDLGKADSDGISALFSLFCSYFNIESKSITGYIKLGKYQNFEELITKTSFTWNYIKINSNYYLVDVSLGKGYFENGEFNLEYSDLFFATKPEIFIHYHYPNESKWQLLSKTYTINQFDSIPLLQSQFYTYGFKTFSPNYKEIKGTGQITITLIYDPKYTVVKASFYLINSSYRQVNDINVKTYAYEGKLEFVLTKNNKKTLYFIIVASKSEYLYPQPLIMYKLSGN